MSRDKEEQPLKSDSSSAFEVLTQDAAGAIARHLSFRDILNLACTSTKNYQLFKSLSKRALTYVAQGKLDALIVEGAKANIVEFDQELELGFQANSMF
jgi:hypothetical protein